MNPSRYTDTRPYYIIIFSPATGADPEPDPEPDAGSGIERSTGIQGVFDEEGPKTALSPSQTNQRLQAPTGMPTQAPTVFPTFAPPPPGSPIEPIAQGIVCGPEVPLTRRLIEKADGSVDVAFVPLTDEDQEDKRTRERLERRLAPTDSPEACYKACFDRLAPDNCECMACPRNSGIGCDKDTGQLMRLCHAPPLCTQPTSCSTSIMTIRGSNFAHAAVNARVSLVLHRPYLFG